MSFKKAQKKHFYFKPLLTFDSNLENIFSWMTVFRLWGGGEESKFFTVCYKPSSAPTTPYLVFNLIHKMCPPFYPTSESLVSINIHGQNWVAVTVWHYHKTGVETKEWGMSSWEPSQLRTFWWPSGDTERQAHSGLWQEFVYLPCYHI